MRKNSILIIMLLVGVVAFTVAPAFADYNQSDIMLDQADNTVFGMGDMSTTVDGPGNYLGIRADDNTPYGPGTIEIPYHTTYGFPGCGTVNAWVTDDQGNGMSTLYGCNEDELGIDAGLILQDLFSEVKEGTTAKLPGQQGIAQYLDSLFAYNGQGLSSPDLTGNNDQGTVYINQTLDQDLADLTAGSPDQWGIWQRLHQNFVHAENGTPGNSTFSHFDADGIDQTLVAFLSEEGGPGTISSTGVVISYMAQWFQMGNFPTCGEAEVLGNVNLCSHTEVGGHGSAFQGATGTQVDITSHDP
jgi:hypothetical protein